MSEYDTARDSFEANLIDENKKLKAEIAALNQPRPLRAGEKEG